MSSSTFDADGNEYNVSKVLTSDLLLNQTAMDAYSKPHWSISYVFYFFWGFACLTGACFYAALWHGKESWLSLCNLFRNDRKEEYDDPYLKLMSKHRRVPHWWYMALLGICIGLSLGAIYGGGFHLPWWGFLTMVLIAFGFMFPGGIVLGISDQMLPLNILSELVAGALFRGDPIAVLTALTYGGQIFLQSLNLVIDYKFGFYMRIPETEMFIGQVWGTLLGPFINLAVMRGVISAVGVPTLTGQVESVNWDAAQSRNFYSTSVLWGIIGPSNFFSQGSIYSWVYWGFLVGPAAVLAVYMIQRIKPTWNLAHICNPVLMFYGIGLFPIYPTTSILTSFIFALIFMGYIYHYHPAFWRKYHYLAAVGLDCGAQLMSTIMALAIDLPHVSFPTWWGNNPTFPDRCFPPNSKLPRAMQKFPSR